MEYFRKDFAGEECIEVRFFRYKYKLKHPSQHECKWHIIPIIGLNEARIGKMTPNKAELPFIVLTEAHPQADVIIEDKFGPLLLVSQIIR